MSRTINIDILVAGNGPAGMAAALSLAVAGFQVVIAAPQTSRIDQRTTTLMVPSIRLLESIGVWESVKPDAAALTTMRIIDATSRLVRARTVSFNAAEIGEYAFGWNMPNTALNAALSARMAACSSIRIIESAVDTYTPAENCMHATMADGKSISAKLIVGADGRDSPARHAAGIETRNWTYPQSAFVTTFRHALSHEGISSEFHTEQGPCVQVPLPGNRSSLVWVVKPEKAAELSALDDRELSLAIEARLSSILGKVEVEPSRQTFPLSGRYPLSFARNRIALVGEAAHVFPPIGAQGLNLGLRDVEDLVAAAVKNPVDPGADTVLAAYDRTRRPDIFARTGAVDALNRALLSSLLPAQVLRSAGMAFLDMVPPLRGLFMREGMRPGDGLRRLGLDIRESVRGKKPLRDPIE